MNPFDAAELQAIVRNLNQEMPIHTDTTAKIKRAYSQGMPKNLMEYSARVDNKFLNDNLAIIEEMHHRDQIHPIPKWFRNYQLKHYSRFGILNHDGFFASRLRDGFLKPDLIEARAIGSHAMMNFKNVGFTSVIGNSKVFNPLDVAGCKLWLKADAGVTKDGGDLVSNWADQSGNSNDVAQATATNKPLWVDSVYAGKPTIRFDGVDNYMSKATFAGGALAQTNFIFLVSTFPDSGEYAFDSANVEPNRHALLHSPATNYDVYAGTELTGGTVSSSLQQLTMKYAGSSSYLRRNGSQLFSGNAGTGNMSGVALAVTYTLGAGFANIDICEMLIYNASLSDTDRDDIENYLKTKWGL